MGSLLGTMEHLPDLNNLKPYYEKADLVQQCVAQIAKDFAFMEITVEVNQPLEQPYQQLVSALLPIVEDLARQQPEKLLSLLYRIDLSEQALSQGLKVRDQEPYAEVVTDLIIERELKKVILRNHYSKQS